MNNRKVKLGFIGLGFVCQQCHLPTFSINENFEIIAISDPFEDLRKNIALRYGIKNVYSSHLEMLETADIDAVVITLPRRLSYSVLKDCLEKNKWVFTEKPLCLNLHHAEEIYNLAIERKRSIFVGYMKNSDSGTKLFKEKFDLIPKDSIKTIRAFCHCGYSYASPFGDIKGNELNPLEYNLESYPNWLNKELEFSYEQYLNTFSHITNVLEFITENKLSFVNYHGSNSGEGFLSAFISQIKAPVIIETSRGEQNKWIEGIEIVYESNVLSINYPAAFLRNVPATIKILKGESFSSIETIRPQWSWSFLNQTYEFFKMINTNEVNHENLISSINQIRLVNDLYKFISN